MSFFPARCRTTAAVNGKRQWLPNSIKQSNQESETISLFCVDSPCVRNRVCIESFRQTGRSTRSFGCEQRGGIIDYVWIRTARGTKAHHRNCKALSHPSTINERRRDGGRRQRTARGFCQNGRIILPWPIMREPSSSRPLHLCQRQGSNQNIAQTVSRCMPCWSGVYSGAACTVRLLG